MTKISETTFSVFQLSRTKFTMKLFRRDDATFVGCLIQNSHDLDLRDLSVVDQKLNPIEALTSILVRSLIGLALLMHVTGIKQLERSASFLESLSL
jgi:hypothetical protein